MADDGYRGYNINAGGEVVEFYDHRSEFVPGQQVQYVQKRPKGCCGGCIGCMEGCQKSPTASIIAFIFIFIGAVLWCTCGILGINISTQYFEEYGPAEGNPATDPPPEWIKGPGMYDEWRLIDPDKPGNYWPMVTERLKYCMYVICPLTVLMGMIMLCDGYQSVQEFAKVDRRRGCKGDSAGICCSVFLIGISWFSIIGWALFVGFNGLAVYYYRMVAERCHDRFDRNFYQSVYPEICIDLVQLGVVQFKNTVGKAYGKFCGEGKANAEAYGDLEEYCKVYQTPYILFICSLVGAFFVMLGFLQFAMSLAANYSLLQKKFSRPMAKYRQQAQQKAQETDTQRLIPPSHAPSVPGVHIPSNKGDFDPSYAQPPGYGSDYMGEQTVNGDIPMQSRGGANYRSNASVDNYYKRY